MSTTQQKKHLGLNPERFTQLNEEIKQGLQEAYEHADDMPVKQQFKEAMDSLDKTKNIVTKALANWK